MTTKERNMTVKLVNDILEGATTSQRAVDSAMDLLISFIENHIEEKKFQEGVDYAIEVIADEFGDYDITEKDLKNLF